MTKVSGDSIEMSRIHYSDRGGRKRLYLPVRSSLLHINSLFMAIDLLCKDEVDHLLNPNVKCNKYLSTVNSTHYA